MVDFVLLAVWYPGKGTLWGENTQSIVDVCHSGNSSLNP